MLEAVKLALRISHNLLDDDIVATIEEARADMIRSGVSSEVAENDEYPLTSGCIKTYCLFRYANKDDAQRYEESYKYQLDCLRKSSVGEV